MRSDFRHSSLPITMKIVGKGCQKEWITFTGKTSLANLMYNHWQQSGKNVHYISFARYEAGQDLDEEDWGSALMMSCGALDI